MCFRSCCARSRASVRAQGDRLTSKHTTTRPDARNRTAKPISPIRRHSCPHISPRPRPHLSHAHLLVFTTSSGCPSVVTLLPPSASHSPTTHLPRRRNTHSNMFNPAPTKHTNQRPFIQFTQPIPPEPKALTQQIAKLDRLLLQRRRRGRDPCYRGHLCDV